MEARELRIGNYIINGIGEVFEANGETINSFRVGQSLLGIFKPIPLTEEWLIKFGFIQYGDEGEYFKHKKLFAFEFLNQGIEFKVYFSDVVFTHVKHVHQLQNLYFSLTGKELTIKE